MSLLRTVVVSRLLAAAIHLDWHIALDCRVRADAATEARSLT